MRRLFHFWHMKILNILISLDMTLNAVLGGYPGETVSGRAWRLRANQPYKTLRPILDWAFSHWGPDHCERSYNARNSYLP